MLRDRAEARSDPGSNASRPRKVQGWRPNEKPAHRASGLRSVRSSRGWRWRLREVLHEWRRFLLVALVVLLRIIVAEDHATVLRLVLHRGRAIGRCRLLSRGHIVQPNPTHAGR